MINPREKYENALAAFATPGGRWANKGRLTYWGKAAGLTADEIIADARATGVTDRDADIRRGWNDASPKGRSSSKAHVLRSKQSHPRFTNHVRNILAGMDADKGTLDWIRELSPCLDWLGEPTEAQTAAFVRAAFRPDELLFVFRADVGTNGVPGVNIKTADVWLKDLDAMRTAGDLVKINPFTGESGHNKNGQRSYVSQDCLADYPFALMEFDTMPLPMQCAFWRAFIMTHKLAPALVSLTYSGGKSLHGLLNVECHTLIEWQVVRKRLIDLFAADTDERFRIDPQALQPLIGTRIPGVKRRNNGVLQELVYLNPCARACLMPQPPMDHEGRMTITQHAAPIRKQKETIKQAAQGTPPYHPADVSNDEPRFVRRCAECQVVPDCKAAFGRFWAEKSSGGIGCHAPFKGWGRISHSAKTTTQECFTL